VRHISKAVLPPAERRRRSAGYVSNTVSLSSGSGSSCQRSAGRRAQTVSGASCHARHTAIHTATVCDGVAGGSFNLEAWTGATGQSAADSTGRPTLGPRATATWPGHRLARVGSSFRPSRQGVAPILGAVEGKAPPASHVRVAPITVGGGVGRSERSIPPNDRQVPVVGPVVLATLGGPIGALARPDPGRGGCVPGPSE